MVLHEATVAQQAISATAMPASGMEAFQND
jgi:hypothetical protein